MRKCFLLALVTTISLMQSCTTTPTPEDYYDQIVDVVKCQIACADYVVECNSEASTLWGGSLSSLLGIVNAHYQAFVDFIGEMYVSTEHSYGDCLYLTAHDTEGDFQSVARNILKNYNNLSVYLSEFTPVATHEAYKNWSFYELRTNIKFLFALEFSGDQWLYSTTVDQNSLNSYIDKQK